MSKTINIQVTFDAEGIMAAYPNPSSDQNRPTGLPHNYGFMVATSNTMSGSGTGDLVFSALVGDVVRFFGATASNNFENSALIYDLPRYTGDQVFSTFHSKTFTKSGVSPKGEAVLPATISDQKFWFYEADVINKGTEGYKVTFALYKRNSSGTPVIFGYFSWDPTITVQG
jgi:hypothetical protein